jgi:Ca2+-binding RTX toxin-like protein
MSLATGINSIDSLVYRSWNPVAGQAVSLTYNFLTRVPADASSDDANGFKAMNVTQQQAVREAMASWSAVANISFTEVASRGDIQLGTNDQGVESSGYAYLPNGSDPVALYINNKDSYNLTFADGDFGLSVLIHELGHTLGFKHPGNYDSTGGEMDGPFLPAATDTVDYSQMSYNTGAGYHLNGNYGITPMLYDIEAMQYLYGANMSYHTGADTYTFSRDAALQCIWDAGGTDTLDFSACAQATVINLNAGSFSETAPGYHNISIAYNVTIERAIAGNGGSTMYANAGGNTLTGGAGSDIIYEGAGSDQISGGGGRDTVVFSKAFSAYVASGAISALTVIGDGVDTMSNISTLQFSDRTVQLANFSGLLGGTANSDVLSAGAGNEMISGGAGIDLVKFSGALSSYAVAASGSGVTVADQAGNGGTDLLGGVERIEFGSGGGLALDTSGEAGQLYRLYGAMFDRVPDDLGMGFWLYRMDHGQSLVSIAKGFINSPEFVRTYGENANDSLFVTSLYRNVLNREPDAAGFAVQLNALTNGMSREQLLVNFSESAENIEVISHVIPVGVSYTPWIG